MGQPSDPKRSPSAARRTGIEDWLAERLARTLGENPDEDLDDIDEIVQLDPLDDPGPNMYDDEADTTRRRIPVAGAAPPKSVGYPVAGRGGRPAEESPVDEQAADPDEYATVIAADAPANASSAEAPTVYADGPQFQTSQVFEIVEPAPGEITKPIPPDADRPEVWDLLGDNTSATVAETPPERAEPRFTAEDPTVAAVHSAEVFAESTAPVHMDEIIDEIEPEPLDSVEIPSVPREPLPQAEEAPSAEIAMPAAEAPSPLEPTATGYGGPRPPAEIPREPIRPVLANTSFSSRNAEDPHTTWSAVEVADGAPPPTPMPMPIPLSMPEPSLKVTPARAATPIPAAPVTPPAVVSWMPALPVPLRDAETEIRLQRADDPPTVAPAHATVSAQPADGPPTLHLAEAPTSASAEALAETVEAVRERVEPKHQPDLVDPAPLELPGPASGRTSDPGTAPAGTAQVVFARASDPVSGPIPGAVAAHRGGEGPDLAVDAARVATEGYPTEPAIPAALVIPGPPPPPPGLVPVRTPIHEARVEGTVTEHGFADLGGSVQTWLAAAFGLVTAVVFVGMMAALILWFQVGTGP